MDYAAANGVLDATKYPYNATKTACKRNKLKPIYSPVGMLYFEDDLRGEEDYLLDIFIGYGPFAVTISEWPQFRNFKSTGVLKNATCSQAQDKGTRFLVVVGYGTTPNAKPKEDYWIVRGSLGTAWGDKGYAKIVSLILNCGIAYKYFDLKQARGNNFCGIGNSYYILGPQAESYDYSY